MRYHSSFKTIGELCNTVLEYLEPKDNLGILGQRKPNHRKGYTESNLELLTPHFRFAHLFFEALGL